MELAWRSQLTSLHPSHANHFAACLLSKCTDLSARQPLQHAAQASTLPSLPLCSLLLCLELLEPYSFSGARPLG